MQVTVRQVGDVTILDLVGKITLGEGDEKLKDAIMAALNAGQRKFLLNMAEVPYIDSSGLRELVRCFTTVRDSGGALKLLGIARRITDLLSVTKLLEVFKRFENEQEALRSFEKS